MGQRSFSATRLALILASAVILPLVFGIPAADAAAAPPNDGFATATVLTGSDGTVTGSNAGATKEAGEPAHADNPGGSSVWYRWTPPAPGRATFSTAGSSFDTLLAVYTGSSVGSLTVLVRSDDAGGAVGVHSSVAFNAVAGVAYQIAVDGFAEEGGPADTGSIKLSWAGVALPASINVTAPNGGESVTPGTTVPITFTYGPPAAPRAAAPSTPPPAVDESDLDAAAATAARDGSVQSIVRLSAAFAPEGHLGQAQARGQRQGIAEKRQGLLGRLKGTDHTVVRTYDSLPLVALRLSPAAVARLRGAPEVAGITEDTLSPPILERSTILVEGKAAHDAGFDGSGQMVAVLDSGVDKAHPFLAGKVVEEACYSATADCPNGQTSQTGPGSGVPCTYNTGECAHGTVNAGIVAGGGATSTGVARGASLMSVQVFGRRTGPECSGRQVPCANSQASDQLAGLERVFALRNTHSIAAVNMSIGGGSYVTCEDHPAKLAIDNLRSVGIPTIIGSGNDGLTSTMAAPACISSAVSVGASTKTDSISSFSNSAPGVALVAPGSDITSSIPGGGFQPWSGTSMAGPHVAGAWAVLKQLKPTASVNEVLAVLQSTGRPIFDARNGLTKPRIRIHRAMVALDPKVRIDLLRGGTVVTNIVDNVPVPPGGQGSHSWVVPAGLPAANDYTVRVTSVPDPRASDASNTGFTIAAPAAPEATGDYDGNGTTDVAVYRPSTGVWYVQSPFGAVKWGETGDVPVPGDYDGNGSTEQAVHRPSTGVWYLLGPNPRATHWGDTGDIPVPGDYDGNGTTDVAVYRPSTGVWYVQSPFKAVRWGETGDIPIPGDYDGNGSTELAVYRPSTGVWYLYGPPFRATKWGEAGDVPVPGDYDGNGSADVAVYRPSTGVWYVQSPFSAVKWGEPGDVPVPGDYGGNGSTEAAVYRPSTGVWYLYGPPFRATKWGETGDLPLTLPQAVYRRFF